MRVSHPRNMPTNPTGPVHALGPTRQQRWEGAGRQLSVPPPPATRTDVHAQIPLSPPEAANASLLRASASPTLCLRLFVVCLFVLLILLLVLLAKETLARRRLFVQGNRPAQSWDASLKCWWQPRRHILPGPCTHPPSCLPGHLQTPWPLRARQLGLCPQTPPRALFS